MYAALTNALPTRTALTALFSSALILGYSIAALSVWQDFRETDRRGADRAEAVAALLEEHAHGIIDAVDQLTRRVDVLMGKRAAKDLADAQGLREELRAAAASLSYVAAIRIIDGDGNMVLSSDPVPTSPLSLADDPSFRAVREGAPACIGELTVDRITGEPVFVRALRLEDDTGTFAGAVMVSLDVAYFRNLYKRSRLDSTDAFGMMRSDGRIIVREPLDMSLIGRSLADTPLFREHIPRARHGVFEQVSRIDGIARIWAYRTVEGQPVVVVSSIGLDVVMAPWRRRTAWTVGIALVGTLTAGGLLTAARRGARREDEALRALTEANDARITLIEESPVPIVTLDGERRITGWNRAAERSFSRPRGDAVGRPVDEVLHLLPDNGNRPRISELVIDGATDIGRELKVARDDGSQRDVVLFSAPFVGRTGAYSGTVCIFDDDTERKRIAQQLQQAQKMEALGQLTGGIAHDFNNLLSIILGSLESLEDYLGDSPAVRELRETAIDAALRGADLTRSLLAFARSQPLRPTRVDVREQLALAFRMLGRTLGEQIDISLVAPDALWPIQVDPVQFTSAITNLAINARDAMPRGGTLIVEARNVTVDPAHADPVAGFEPGEYVVIEVSDSGEGMAPDVVARAFDPFFTTKPAGKGTGLGLSMVYGFARQSGGHVKIYSEPAFGTSVFLYFPRLVEDTGGPAAESEAPAATPRGTETVLLVEDNPGVRATTARLLRSLGYRIIEAPDGPSALKILEGGTPVDLLITDVVMPHGMTGYDLAAATAELRPSMRTLITSGFPGAVFERLPESKHNRNYLAKPYRKEQLAAAVRAALDQP